MRKVSFYISNSNFAAVDCSNILNANPGLGGTQYMIIVVAYLLTIRNNDIYVELLSQVKGRFPKEVHNTVVGDLASAVKYSDSNAFDYISYAYLPSDIHIADIYENVHKLKLLPWCHCFVEFKDLDYLAKCRNVAQIINVGKEQLDIYIDHPAYEKSTYIYNCINVKHEYREQVFMNPFNKRSPIVTFMGSIVPMKSFHRLAYAWPKIIKMVPDAQLYVIGSGKLYWRDAKLGKFGIAEEKYENYFMKPLLKDGKILPSVHFLGILGDEKNDILKKTKVGVPNPLGSGETFCISAVEMELMGAKIAAKKAPGYMDTVKNGHLCNSINQLARTIVNLLMSTNSDYEVTYQYIKENFSYDVVIKDWEELINKGELRKNNITNTNYRFKQVKYLIRNLKYKYPILSRIPSVEGIFSYWNIRITDRLKKIKYKVYDFHDVVD